MSEYYDRYKNFRSMDGSIITVPFVPIPKNGSDIYITFDKNTMRLDTLSYKYYNDPNYGWLIMQANPQYGGYEYAYNDGIRLRIPYPLSIAIGAFEIATKNSAKAN